MTLTSRLGIAQRRAALAVVLTVATTGLAACGSGGDDELVVYSGRSEALVAPILERFEEETGIDIRVQYADTSELTPTLLEEGENSPADVFFSQDAGALAALADEGMLAELPAATVDNVDARFRDPENRWIGVSGRARVIGYNTDRVAESELPESVFDVVDPKWKGRIAFAPTNASFIAFVSALTESVGRDGAKEFLEGLKANDAKAYDNNVLALEAVESGEADIALVNHYYRYAAFKDQPDAPLANHYTGQGASGEGTFVNVAGIGMLETSERKDDAQRLIDFLLGEEAQEYFREETSEYPLRDGVDAISELPPLASLKTIDVPLSDLGDDLEETTELLKEVGLT